MAQIAVPVLLLGVAYLISNDKKKESSCEQEGFSELTSAENQGNLIANRSNDYQPNEENTILNTNNTEQLSQYQDKYFLNNINKENKNDNIFETLAGNQIKTSDLNHNNMNLFYSSKSNGHNTIKESSILDNYTGQGTYDIKKDETAAFFKPESNIQNVYGNQNQNDFLQSRVNSSQRHANTKPWEEIKDTPGIGMKYDESSTQGLNNFNMKRDMYTPKTVDELRASNNPKMVYTLDNHMGPAINPITNMGHQGKIVKKTPDLTTMNSNLGMIAKTSGPNSHMRQSHQMLTNENRPSTSVEYYGVKGSGQDQPSYVSGTYMEPHKQQLSSPGPYNMSIQGTNPTNTLNYNKGSYSVLNNNRSVTQNSHFGNIGGLISNVVEPLVKGLRHSKKTNSVTNSNPSGNVNGGYRRPSVYNPNESVSTTNRQMYEDKLSMNHLNVQKQDGTAYMNTRPLLNDTQRSTLNQNQSGPAASSVKGRKNYDAEYNQRNQNKVTACNVHSHGNMELFNNKVNMIETNKELCNDRQTPFYSPQMSQFEHPTEVLGQFTNLPQEYENKNQDTIDSSLLQAFKQNPYTQSLQSVI